MSRKTYIFKEPSHFTFKKDGIGILISKSAVAMISSDDKTAILFFENLSEVELKNVEWKILIERSDQTIIGDLVKVDTKVEVPDVEISGELV